MADAGWYPDAQDPNAQHYFDGQNWTGHRRPNPDSDVAAAPVEETVRRSDLPGFGQQSGQPSGWGQPDQQPGQQSGQPSGWGQPDQQTSAAPSQPWQAPPSAPWDQQPNQQAGQPWQYGQPGPADQGDPSQHGGWPGQPTPARSGRRKPVLIIAGVAVVAVVAGLVTWLVLPGDDAPTITYGGKEVASASDTLSKADEALATAVKSRKGASNDDTRCYFARPAEPASGAKKSDVENALRCGPVLFVDGQKSEAYLRVPLTDRADGSKVTLTASENLDDLEPTAVSSDLELVRPDGKSAPDGVGDLSVPEPPAAEKDVLTSAAIADSSALKRVNAVMGAKNTKVTLVSAGEVERYGSGDDARSAPSGQKLYAFQLAYGAGDVDSSNDAPAQLVVDGGTGRAIPATTSGNYVVAAVPSSGSATIVLTDGGYRQTLALPSGAAGAGNIDVLTRTTRTGFVGGTTNVPIELRQGSRRASATFRTTASIASLNFWPPGNTTIHPTSPKKAILTVRLNYTDSDSPGKTYGYDPALVRLRIANYYVKARNIASAGKILNVFEVPANFSSGVLQVQGSTKVGAITVRVKQSKSFAVRIR